MKYNMYILKEELAEVEKKLCQLILKRDKHKHIYIVICMLVWCLCGMYCGLYVWNNNRIILTLNTSFTMANKRNP